MRLFLFVFFSLHSSLFSLHSSLFDASRLGLHFLKRILASAAEKSMNNLRTKNYNSVSGPFREPQLQLDKPTRNVYDRYRQERENIRAITANSPEMAVSGEF